MRDVDFLLREEISEAAIRDFYPADDFSGIIDELVGEQQVTVFTDRVDQLFVSTCFCGTVVVGVGPKAGALVCDQGKVSSDCELGAAQMPGMPCSAWPT